MKPLQPLLLSEHRAWSADPQSYTLEPITYLTSCVPDITIEYQTTTYYTSMFDDAYYYFMERDEAHHVHAQHVQELTHRLQHAQRVFEQYGTTPTDKIRHDQAARMIEHKMYDLRTVEDHGVQQHTERIPVYTITVSAVFLTMFPNTWENTDTSDNGTKVAHYIDPDTFLSAIKNIMYKLCKYDYEHKDLFGYDSLAEAVEHEPYLQAILQHYTIHQLYDTHVENFQYDDAYEKVHRYRTFEPTLQRYLMRHIYDRPGILEHLETVPLSWLIHTIDHGIVDESDIVQLFKNAADKSTA